MSCYRGSVGRPAAALMVALTLFSLLGCREAGPKTYPVQGKVVVTGGSVSQLAGSNVEFQLEDNPPGAGYGDIKADGGFQMGVFHKGKQLSGMPEGTYQARILLLSEDDDGKRRPAPVDKRFLEFDTSKLSYQVGGAERVLPSPSLLVGAYTSAAPDP